MNIISTDYIDGLNKFAIQDYIDEQINNNIITNIYSSNIHLNNNNYLDKTLYYDTDSNLYICNSNNFKEIRFTTSGSYPVDNTKKGTIIDFTGKLMVYHNYSALKPTFPAGYYDVEDEILQLKADGINTDLQLTALEAGAVFLQDEIYSIQTEIIIIYKQLGYIAGKDAKNLKLFGDIQAVNNFNGANQLFGQAIEQFAVSAGLARTNAFINGVVFSAGVGFAGLCVSTVASYLSYEKASNALYSNANISEAEKNTIYTTAEDSMREEYKIFSNSIYNLNNASGFINSNITTRQLISDLQADQITLNNKTITKFSLDNLNNFVKTQYGIYYDISDGTLAIASTPTTQDFLVVGGQTTIQGDLFVNEPNKSLKFGSRLQDNLIDLYGNTYVLGVATNILKYKAPTGASHKFYINNVNVATIDINGITAAGNNIAGLNWNNITINKPTVFPPDMTNVYTKTETDNLLNAKLALSGGTMTGALNINLTSGGQYIYLYNSSSTTSGVITFANNTPDYGYIGMGGTNEGGNYSKNLFIQADNSLIFNSGFKQSGDIPRMIILANGNIGIGTDTPNYRLDVNGSLNIYTPSSYFGLVLGSYPYSFIGSTNNNNGVAGLMVSCKNSTNSTVITKPIIYSYCKDIGTTNMNTVTELRCQGNALNSPYYWGSYIRCDGSYAQNIYKNASGGSISFWSQDAGGTYRASMLMSSSSTVAGTITNTLIVYGNLEANNLTIQTGGIINTPTITTSSILYNGSSIDNKFVLKTGDTITGNLNINNKLTVNGDLLMNPSYVANGLAVAESRIIAQGGTLTGVFAGDTLLNSYWGIAMNINSGGAGDAADASLTKIPQTSSFTINTRSTNTSTGFDKTLFTVRNSGNVGIGTNSPACKLQIWNGVANVNAGSSYSVSNNYLSAGAISIGSTTADYGFANSWGANTCALMLECYDRTEVGICIGNNVTGTPICDSLFAFSRSEGYITVGRDMGWGTTDCRFAGKILGAYNVCKRNSLIFTPSQNTVSPFNWYYNINLANYITFGTGADGVQYYIFRIIISTWSANYADSNENCQTMMFNVFLSNYGGGNGTCRIYQILNSSTLGTLVWINSTTVGYYCSNSSIGASATKVCTIENIAVY